MQPLSTLLMAARNGRREPVDHSPRKPGAASRGITISVVRNGDTHFAGTRLRFRELDDLRTLFGQDREGFHGRGIMFHS